MLILTEVFKALGDENRIRILNLLVQQELCVCEMEEILDISQSNASRHLNKLKAAGLITSSKNAQWVYYQISDFLKTQNDFLYRYIESEVKNIEICMADLEGLRRYRCNPFTCSLIGEVDKE